MSEKIVLSSINNSKKEANLYSIIKKEFPDSIKDHHTHRGDETIIINSDSLEQVCSFLKYDSRCSFEMMIDLTAVDRLEMGLTPRFEMVYHFKSLTHATRLRLKTVLPDDDCRISSIHHLWKAVDWYERECFDMFGIHFEGHPDLRRILMYDGFDGHPLRKDYPIDKQQPIEKLKEIDERHIYGRNL